MKRLVSNMDHHFREELLCQCGADWYDHQAAPRRCVLVTPINRPDIPDLSERNAAIVADIEAGQATAMVAHKHSITPGSVRKIYCAWQKENG